MVGVSLAMVPSIWSDFAERIEHTRSGKELRQNNRFAFAAIQQIERHAAASKPLQQSRNLRILRGPVALERDDAALSKGLAHRLAVEGDPFVDQTGDTPGSSQIDKDGLPCCFERREPLRGERLVGELSLQCRIRDPAAGRWQRRGE